MRIATLRRLTRIILKRRLLMRGMALISLLMCIVLLLVSSPAVAQDNGAVGEAAGTSAGHVEDASFGSVFFMASHTDASGERRIEIIGTAIIWLLLTMSMINIALIWGLALGNQRKSILPAGVVEEARRLVVAGEYRQAIELARRDKSFFSELLNTTLSEAGRGLGAMQRTLENTADLLVTSRMRPIEILYMFGQVSPMIGLLGTVYGIIHAFLAFVSAGGHASPTLLAGGIGTALVATFWGLVVAIPALAGYAVLRNRVDEMTLEATTTVEEIINQFRPRGASAAPATAKPPQAVAVPRQAG